MPNTAKLLVMASSAYRIFDITNMFILIFNIVKCINNYHDILNLDESKYFMDFKNLMCKIAIGQST